MNVNMNQIEITIVKIKITIQWEKNHTDYVQDIPRKNVYAKS